MKDVEYWKNKIRMQLNLSPTLLKLVNYITIYDIKELGFNNDTDFLSKLHFFTPYMEGFLFEKYGDNLTPEKQEECLKLLNEKYF